jgi:hypothetical protein
MMLKLGQLERGGCVRLDQEWNTPSGDELAEVYLAANERMLNVLKGPSEQFQGRSQAIQAELQEALQALAKGICYDCAWLSLTALSTVTRNLWL